MSCLCFVPGAGFVSIFFLEFKLAFLRPGAMVGITLGMDTPAKASLKGGPS
jgi:hypothetical protein